MYYRIVEKLAEEPRGAQNGWQGLAAVLRPEELATAGLPRGVAEQAAEKLAECRGCRLTVEPDCIQGELHIPAKGKHKPRNLLFAWWKDSLLFVDRGETAAECLETVRRMRPHHADGADDLLMAKMDVRLIVQVIINIVNNAIKYTPVGSNIVLSARKQENWVCVQIADDGPGISHEAKAHLFDMFYTAGQGSADSRRGLGLGLSLCKSIVNAHGGEITVADQQPHGAIFTFSIFVLDFSCNHR